MTNTTTIRTKEDFKSFVLRASTNRVIAGIDSRQKTAPEILELIHKYFKMNNDRYLELIAMEDDDV